jgi:hypothetical protein
LSTKRGILSYKAASLSGFGHVSDPSHYVLG